MFSSSLNAWRFIFPRNESSSEHCLKSISKECRGIIDVWIRLVFVLGICSVHVQADLVHGPQNTEAVRGMSVSLPCTTSLAPSQYVNWFYVQTGTTDRKDLYYNNINIKPHYPHFAVSRDEAKGEYNMTISSVEFDDCGLYTCVDKSGFGEQRRAELVVLTSIPTVRSNISLDDLTICNVGVHYIGLTCSLSYKGNMAPTLCWERVTPDGKTTRYTCNDNDTTPYNNGSTTAVTTATTAVVDYTYDRVSFYCYTRTSNIRSAPVTIRVKYVVSNADAMRNASSRHCSVDANVQCEFGLLNANDEAAKAAIQNLAFDSERKYTKLCEYICTIDDQVCKGYQPYYEDASTSCDSYKSTAIGLSIVLVILVLTVVIVIIVVKLKYVVTRKKKKKKQNTGRSTLISPIEEQGDNTDSAKIRKTDLSDR